ncbi:MAG: hypothetical protein ACR2FY_24450 [Pirellulaceae bacterium]
MRRSIVKHLVGRKPFKPFRLTLTTAETFDVKHPEAVYVAKRFLALARPPVEASGSDDAEMVWIDYRHIVHCQPFTKKEMPF